MRTYPSSSGSCPMASQQPREELTNEYVGGYCFTEQNNDKNVDSLFMEMVIAGIVFYRTWAVKSKFPNWLWWPKGHMSNPWLLSTTMLTRFCGFTCSKVLRILRAPSQVFDDRWTGWNVKKWSQACEENNSKIINIVFSEFSSALLLIETINQTREPVFDHIPKHLAPRHIYSATRRIFNSLLGV